MPEFREYLQEKLGSGEPMTSSPEVLSRLLDKYIDDQVFAQAISEKGMKLAPGEIDPLIARFRPPEGEYAPSGTWVAKLENDLLTDRYIKLYLSRGLQVSEPEIDVYYRDHLELFRMPERFRAREILLHDRAEAEQVRRQLLGKGVETFTEAARRLSKSPSAAQGGEMGLRRRGQLPPEIEQAVLPLKPLEVSPVVHTTYGFHIFLLEARLPEELLSLETVRENIERDLFEEKLRVRVERFLRERRDAAKLMIFEKNLGFEYKEEEG